jgi:hypothetical protein
MVQGTIDRKLWFQSHDRRIELSHSDLPARGEPLVILGEAGMGKSHMLAWLGSLPGYAHCTARQLINRHDPRTLLGHAKTLVIDSLDEVSAQKEGDAVGLVLRQLGVLGYPTFVVACRVADWRSATGVEAIREQYDLEPLELHLEPFDDDDAVAFLTDRLGAEIAKNVIEHFNARGLKGLLGNPQTLELISEVAGTGQLPETRSALFERAIEVLRIEHNKGKGYGQLAAATVLGAAGAAFAGLILTGSEALVRTGQANASEGELQLAELVRLPGGEALEYVLATRLFKADGADRFSYWHRRIGEYVGAKWLAVQASTRRKRKRLLSLFHSHGLVPASLRGIHAWLALEPALSQEVIAADPMGVIEYGDADDLTVGQARALLTALEVLSLENPGFRHWRPYSIGGLAKPELLEELRTLIAAQGTSFGLRVLILEAIKGSAISSRLASELRSLVLDPNAIFAVRSAAGDALVELVSEKDWPEIARSLLACGDASSVRLAFELTDEVGYDVLDDHLIVDLVACFARDENPVLGVLMKLERDLPLRRLNGVLDRLAEVAKASGKPNNRRGDSVLTDFAFHLISRRVASGYVHPEKLWLWLEPFDTNIGYQRESRQQLDACIRNDDSLRRAVQRLVMIEQPNGRNLWDRQCRLSTRSSGLVPTPEDLIELLQALDPSDQGDERWREILRLARHDGEVGAEVRRAARPFAASRRELLDWIDELALPRTPNWRDEHDEYERKQRAKREIERAKQRKSFAACADRMRAGDYGANIAPARAYLNLFHDVGEGKPAHERVAEWLGEEIGATALLGFEAFLFIDPPKPSAIEISESMGQGRRWDAGYIIVAALAERLRKGEGFSDVSDDRLMAGLFETRGGGIEARAGIKGLQEAIEATIHDRGLWANAMRLYHEPQLAGRREHIEGLYSLMREESCAVLGAELALEWISRFPDLSGGPQAELIDRLLRSGKFEDLCAIVRNRRDQVAPESRRIWDSVGLIIDFDHTSKQLDANPIEGELLWQLRDRTAGRADDRASVSLQSRQIEWIVTSFRSRWPMVRLPLGGSSGSDNPWDASDYLTQLIRRLGNNPAEEATAALRRLRNAPVDGYTDAIKSVAADQIRIRVEASYSPPTLDAIDAIARDRAPAAAEDLQASVTEELDVVQAKIKSDDAESWRGFYDDMMVPFGEERCRDHLIGLLRQGSGGITFLPEEHVASDKEVDIGCSVGQLRVPIEVKGQWHKELWRGADAQLDELYTTDWRADGRGIYLVLWFGERSESNKRLTSPGLGQERPQTHHELREMLAKGSQAAHDGRVVIFVLNLERS